MLSVIGSLLVDISMIYLLVLCFIVGQKSTKYIYRRFFYKNDDVLVRLKRKDGSVHEYTLDRETANALIQAAKDNPA